MKKAQLFGIITIILAITVAVIVAIYRAETRLDRAPMPIVSEESSQPVEEENMEVKNKTQKTVFTGIMLSANDKQLYLKITKNKGAAVDIDAATPVKLQGGKMGNLSNIKKGDELAVTTDQSMKVLGIEVVK